jgi:hypothetical protein
MDLTWPLTAIAICGALGSAIHRFRRGELTRAWLLARTPRSRGTSQAIGVLVSSVLAAAAYHYQTKEFDFYRRVWSGAQLPTTARLELNACMAEQKPPGSDADKIHAVTSVEDQRALELCRTTIALDKSKFSAFGFSFGLAAAAAVLSVVYCSALATAIVICGPSKESDGLFGELIERRLARLLLVGGSGWCFSYIMGHSTFARTTHSDVAGLAVGQLALAFLASISAVVLMCRCRNTATTAVGLATFIAAWVIPLVEFRGISNIQLQPAMLTACLLMLEHSGKEDAA